MSTAAQNLKSVMNYFNITNIELAKVLGVDPSLVSRWLNGQRLLKASGTVTDALAGYILERSQRVQDIEWLEAQFEKGGLSNDICMVHRIKQNLILWLAGDGEALRRNLENLPSALDSQKRTWKRTRSTCVDDSDKMVKAGYDDIAIALEALLAVLPNQSEVDIFLSNENISAVVSEELSRLILHKIDERKLCIRLLVCVSGSPQAMSRLIRTYMQPLISGYIRLSVVHGQTQIGTHQMYLIISARCAMLITEIPKTVAPPVAISVHDAVFVREMKKSFELILGYAQPVFYE